MGQPRVQQLLNRLGALSHDRSNRVVAKERGRRTLHVFRQRQTGVRLGDNHRGIADVLQLQHRRAVPAVGQRERGSRLVDLRQNGCVGDDEQLAGLRQHAVIGYPCAQSVTFAQRRNESVATDDGISQLRLHSSCFSVLCCHALR